MQSPQSHWELKDWLYYLENRSTADIQLGLSRISVVAKRLGVLSPKCKVITVAGTNGKGSTVTALETIYHDAGYQVGAYTSPHLLEFNERIRVGLVAIPEQILSFLLMSIHNACHGVFLTYFEMTTLAALLYFDQEQVDVMILEVGLGGRLDATNIIDPDVSVITTIDFDHQEFLGDTLEAIGFEKAGILRKKKPFVYADVSPPHSIIKVSKALDAQGYFYQQDYGFYCDEKNWEFIHGEKKIDSIPIPRIHLKSASAALMVTLLLRDERPVSNSQLFLAMEKIFLPGRLQLEKRPVSLLYDVSHNPQSARLLANYLKKTRWEGRVFAVFSALKDKDILGLILPLKDCVHRWFPAKLENKRASNIPLLLSKFEEAQIDVEICYNSPILAFEAAMNEAHQGDLMVIFGSFYTVSQVMANQHLVLDPRRFNETGNG